MPPFGAHQSISGGYYKAVDLAVASTCQCVQIFTKNNNQWKGKPITPEEAAKFQDALKAAKVTHPLAHNSYLINLAAPDEELWRKSVEAMAEELRRAEILGIPNVVTHPGAFTTSSEEAGLKRIVAALDVIHAETPGLKAVTLLEVTAGQGSCLGHRFEHLATILDSVRDPDRLAVCVDTCHIFAAGYPISRPTDYKKTMAEFDRLIGIKLIKAIHANDSKKGCGSRVDRHEHIGQGEIGLEGFRNLVNDKRLAKVPIYLETPKGDGGEEGIRLDAENLARLRGLVVK